MVEEYDHETLFKKLVAGHKLTADGGKSFVEYNPSYKNPFRHIVNKEKNIPMDELWSCTKWEYNLDTDTKLVFKRWLEKEGVLESYLKYGSPERTKDTSVGLWLGYSNSEIFPWIETDEGFPFWKQINDKWLIQINHHSIVESGF